MKDADVIIIGGGMVGLALAAALDKQVEKIIIIEPLPPNANDLSAVSQRVSALNIASQKMLYQLGLWEALHQYRHCYYSTMSVWEKDSFARIQFSADSLGLDQLGCIVENQIIQQLLWHKVTQQSNVEIIHGKAKDVTMNSQYALVTLEDNRLLMAKLLVGADGANSWLRQQVNIPLNFRDYGHSALVCNVKTELAHEACARQIFSADSILAFLPMHEPHLCSIVWSQPPELAEKNIQSNDSDFNKALTIAFDNQLGRCEVVSERHAIPLTARYARDFAQPRVALIGDAAHTIHPLAGLGVNLGFMDALALAQVIRDNSEKHQDIGEYRALRSYERWRKSEAIKMLTTMQGFKSLFEGDHPMKKLLRGIGMSTTNQLPLVKERLMAQALGIDGDLPHIIKNTPNDVLFFAKSAV